MRLMIFASILSQILQHGSVYATSCTAGNTDCSNACGDVCTCKSLGCEFQSQSTNCYPRSLECKDYHFQDSFECRRPNVFYCFGGEICKSKISSGHCGIWHTYLTANLFGEETRSSRGIIYQAGSQVTPVIGANYVKEWKLQDHYDGPVVGVSSKDQPLFQNMITGIIPGEPGNCTAYAVPLPRDGRFELSIKLLDGHYSSTGKRQFTVKFAGLEVFPEIDVVRLAGSEKCLAHLTPLELAVNFRISPAVKTLEVNGFEPVPIVNGETLLEFCYSQCPNLDSSVFAAAAFSIVRFADHMGLEDCPCYNNDVCECRVRGCDFSSSNGLCSPAHQDCESPTANSPCQRAEALYSTANGICRVIHKNLSCTIEQVVIAVNLGGEPIKDSRGVSYQAGADVTPVLGGNYVEYINSLTVNGVHPEDISLFDSVMYGTWPWSTEQCVAYSIVLTKDGLYELSVKALDGQYDQPGKRFFTIKFAGLDVFPEIDLVQLANGSPKEAKYTGLDLALNFMFTNGAVEINGFDPVLLVNGETLLEFCYSKCSVVDPKFAVAAFAVVKLGSTNPEEECPDWNQNICACKKGGCEYNSETNECSAVNTDCLADNAAINQIDTDCLRDEIWYSAGGSLCQFIGNGSNCTIDETVIGVNFGGYHVLDSRGVFYVPDNTVPPVYGSGLLGYYDPSLIHGVLPDDEPLFDTVMHGYQLPNQTETCVAYAVPLVKNGIYELSIKTVDAYFNEIGARFFTIKFAGFDVFPEIDINRLVASSPQKTPFTATELAVMFKVSGNADTLQVNGFQSLAIQNGETLLEFCFSNCPGIESSSFVAAAFSVVRFSSTAMCPEGDTNVCPDKNSLMYSYPTLPNDTCVIQSCRRAYVWYSDQGILSYNLLQTGKCYISDVNLAINFCDVAMYGDRGIYYEAGNSIKDVHGELPNINDHTVGQWDNVPAHVFYPADRLLYRTLMVGFIRPVVKNPGKCLAYNVTNVLAGSYELSVKTIDDTYATTGMRLWSIKLAGVVVIKNIDMIDLAQQMNMPNVSPKKMALDLSVNFLVTRNPDQVMISGFNPVSYANESIIFEICCGCDDAQDDHWHISAMSVLRFRP